MASLNPSSSKASKGRHVDFLDLPGCTFRDRNFVEHILVIRASMEEVPSACPDCGSKRKKVLNTEDRLFWDTPRMVGQPTLVQLFIPKFVCDACGYRFDTKLPWLHRTRDMTLRLIDFMLAQAATWTTFAQIAFDTGQDPSTISDIFMEAFTKWDEQNGMNLPRTLGIDEVWFHGELYTILVNSETGAGVDLLRGKSQVTIAKRFRSAPNARDVTRLTMDFDPLFRRAAKEPYDPSKKNDSTHSDAEQPEGTFETPFFGPLPNVDAYEPAADGFIPEGGLAAPLPNALVVGDHFHFKQAIEDGLDDVRLHVQNSMPKHYLDLELSRLTKAEAASPDFEDTIAYAKAKAKAARLAEKGASELKKKRFILFYRPDDRKLTDEKRLWLDRIFLEYPLLKKGWYVKNAGLAIFPIKLKAKRSKNAAKEVLATIEPTNDAAVGKRLENWVLSIDEELQPFFTKGINLIKNWRAEIIRIDTTDLSNSRAECKNRFLRMLEAIGRGVKFKTLRARMLWADAHPCPDRWPRVCDGVKRMSARKLIEILDDLEQKGAA